MAVGTLTFLAALWVLNVEKRPYWPYVALLTSAVVMLDGECSFLGCPPGTRIWWGAYLGTPDEILVAGTVGDVGYRIAELRAEARARHGWIMDIYLLRD